MSSGNKMLREKLADNEDSVSIADVGHAVVQGASLVKVVLSAMASLVALGVVGGWWLLAMRDDLDDHVKLPAHVEASKMLSQTSSRLQAVEHSQTTMAETQAKIASTQERTATTMAKIREDVARNTERLKPRRR